MKKPGNFKLIFLLTVSHITRHFVLRDDDIFSNGRIFLFCRIVSFVCHFNKKKFVQMNEKPFKDGGTWCGRWYPGFPAQWRVIFFLGYSRGGHSTTLPSGERDGLCRLRSCDARLRGRRFVKWQKISIETLHKRFNIDCSIVNSLFLSVWS